MSTTSRTPSETGCPDERDLWAVLDGEADAPTAAHAAACPRCAAWLDEARALDGGLRAALAAPASDLELAAHRRRLARAITPRRPLWVAAAAAAAILVALLATDATDSPDPTPTPRTAVTAQVERYSPVRSVADVEVLASRTTVPAGQRVRFEGDHYGRLTVANARWLVHPDSEVAVDARRLVLHRGSVTLEDAGGATAALSAGGFELTGGHFSASLADGGVQLEVLGGQLTLADGATLPPGSHRLGDPAPAPLVDVRREYVLGFERWRAGRFDDAAVHFQRIARADSPLAETASFRLAACYGRAGKYARAIEAIEDFLHRFPASRQTTYARFFLGVYHERLARPEQAREAYESVLREPDSSLHPLARVRLRQLLPEPPRRAARLYAEFSKAWHADRHADAERPLRQVIRLAPDYPTVASGDARFYLWACAFHLGRFADALTALDDYLTRHPDHHARGYSRYFRALTLLRLGRKDDARAELDRLEREHPDDTIIPHARQLRGQLDR